MNLRLLCFLLFSISCFSQVRKPDSLQLFFDSAKYTITEEHKAQVKEFIAKVPIDDVLQIRIKGYTDFVGNHVYNNKLSKKRAKAAYSYISKNYTFKAILQQGMGELDEGMEEELDESDIEMGIDKHRKVDIIFKYERPKPPHVSLTRKQRYLSELMELTVGEKLRLKNIRFKITTTHLTQDSYEEIEGVAKILKANPRIKVRIEGHVCCGGKEEYESKVPDPGNLELSTNRAKAVYDQLVKKGISKKRMSYKGYGFTRPLSYPESKIELQQENRRVELKVLRR